MTTTFDPEDGGYCAVGRQLSTCPAIDIFLTGPTGIYQSWYNEAAGWNLAPGTTDTLVLQPLAAPGAGQKFIYLPSAVSWDHGARLDLFAVSADGELWHWWVEDESQPESGWGGETLGHPGHGPLVSAPAAVSQGVDKITVFARVGGDGALFACVWDPASGKRWEWLTAVELGWAPEPGPFVFSPAACSWDPGRIDLFAVKGTLSGGGGPVQHTWQQDFPGAADWHPDYWEAPATAIFPSTSSPVSVSWLNQGVQQITVLYCGPDEAGSTIMDLMWLGDHWVTNYLYQQVDGDIGVATPPALASWGPGRLDAFWYRSDYTLQHYWNATGEPRTWQPENFQLQFT